MILSAVRIGRYYLAAFILLWQPLATPAHGCSSVSACAGIVDGFFLDLIVGPVESIDAAASPAGRLAASAGWRRHCNSVPGGWYGFGERDAGHRTRADTALVS